MKQEIKRIAAGILFVLLINIPGLCIWAYHNYQPAEFIPCIMAGSVITALGSLILGVFVSSMSKLGKSLIG